MNVVPSVSDAVERFPRGASLRIVGLIVVLVWSSACGTMRLTVVGNAMAPTLNDGDQVIATQSVGQLRRGDIVAFRYPRDESKSFLQRIVGLPGEQIAMTDGLVAINGTPIDEPYVAPEYRSLDTWGPVPVPEDAYFVLGDNRQHSSDSRDWGSVARSSIWAKVISQ